MGNRSACAALSPYPRNAAPMRAAGDNLVKLCEYSWDQKVRLSGAGEPAGICKYNPTLKDVSSVLPSAVGRYHMVSTLGRAPDLHVDGRAPVEGISKHGSQVQHRSAMG